MIDGVPAIPDTWIESAFSLGCSFLNEEEDDIAGNLGSRSQPRRPRWQTESRFKLTALRPDPGLSIPVGLVLVEDKRITGIQWPPDRREFLLEHVFHTRLARGQPGVWIQKHELRPLEEVHPPSMPRPATTNQSSSGSSVEHHHSFSLRFGGRFRLGCPAMLLLLLPAARPEAVWPLQARRS